MKITKARLKEIIKEEVVKIFEEKKPRWIYVDDEESGKSLGIWASSVPEAEEKSEKVDYSKYKDGDDVMSTKKVDEVQNTIEGKRPPGMRKRTMKDLDDEAKTRETDFLKKKKEKKKKNEDLDEMSAMSTGAVATSPKKEPLEEEDGFYEPHI